MIGSGYIKRTGTRAQQKKIISLFIEVDELNYIQ